MMKKMTRLILPILACLLLSGLWPALLPNIAEAAEKTYTITQGTDPAYVSNVEIDKTKAAAGESVTVRILDPSHYSCVVQSCSYADSAGSVTYLLSDADDAPPARDCVITFPMPAKNITVTVGFAKRKTVPQEYLANRDSREYLRMDKVYTKPNTKVNLYVTEPYRKELETIRLEKIVNGRYSHWYDIPGVPGTNVYTLTSPDDSDTSVYLELFWRDAPQYSVHANCSPGNGGTVQGTGQVKVPCYFTKMLRT